MNEALLNICQYLLAMVLGLGGWKGGQYVINRYRQNDSEIKDTVLTKVCNVKHDAIESTLNNIKSDIEEVKTSISKIVELQLDAVKLDAKIDMLVRDVQIGTSERMLRALQQHENRLHR
jgi:hypothetical protein